MITDARNIAVLTYIILIGSWEGIYLCLMFNKTEGKETMKKEKIYFILKQVLSDT